MTLALIEAQIAAAIERGASADELEALALSLDEATPASRTFDLGASARWYAGQGLHVFPLRPRSKIPYPGTKGCKDATDDAQRIRDWWSAEPRSNIGIATGHLVDVVDIDGPKGVVSYCRELFDDDDEWQGPPILGRVSTPRAGGHHIYIAATPGAGNRAALLPGIDTRGTGGYVVAPPSVNDDGKPYVWTMPLVLA